MRREARLTCASISLDSAQSELSSLITYVLPFPNSTPLFLCTERDKWRPMPFPKAQYSPSAMESSFPLEVDTNLRRLKRRRRGGMNLPSLSPGPSFQDGLMRSSTRPPELIPYSSQPRRTRHWRQFVDFC